MDRVQLSTINLLSHDEDREAANRRRPGRMRCEKLRCQNGTVMDISITGVRVRVRSLFAPCVDRVRELVFQTAMGPSVPFRCRIKWIRSAGFLTHEMGLEFMDMDSSHREQLAEIARVHGGRTVIRDLSGAA